MPKSNYALVEESGFFSSNTKGHGNLAGKIFKNTLYYEGNGCVPCPCAIDALYLSVLDFEYSTLKAIKFCVGLNK